MNGTTGKSNISAISLKSRRHSTKDNIFNWNNQSGNIQMVTWKSGSNMNIKILEKNRNHGLNQRPSSMIPEHDKLYAIRKRTRSLPYNAYNEVDTGRYLRQLRYSMQLDQEEPTLDEGVTKRSRELTIKKFKYYMTKVQLYIKIFKRIFMHAMERGNHDQITHDARLQQENLDEDILFDPGRFKTNYQGFFPSWAKVITRKTPHGRTEEDIDSLVRLLRQLKDFRRKSHRVQRLICKVVRYDRFGRHRVIIRKGHVGRHFYIIYSGTVCFTLSEDDQKVLSNKSETDYYNLKKGDSFGELALLRSAKRAATIVCLEKSEFLSVDKDDFSEIGIIDILRVEMEQRVVFLRGLDLFSTWPADLLRKVAEESRTLEFRSDLVVDRNLMMSDMVYVVTKGQCHILRLLDLTNSKKWITRRRHQNKLYGSVFHDNLSSSSCSRRGTCSRLSAFSNTTSFYDANITRSGSNPQLRRKTPIPEIHRPRMVKSAFTKRARTTEKKSVRNDCKPDQTYDLSRTRHLQVGSDRGKSACSKAASELSKCGAGVFLRLDIIEKGQIAGLGGILRTDEDTSSNTNTDSRRLFLVSKGCKLISLPIEVLKKHADFEILKKAGKHIKMYPNDEQLLDCYLELSDWNTYKEVLLGNMVKEIEKRKSSAKPGTTLRTNGNTRYDSPFAISRLETRKTYEGRRSTNSRRERTLDQDPEKLSQMLRSPSSITVRSTNESFCYPYKPSEMIYAQGSHRSLVLVNGGIGNNTIQKELEEQLWTTSPVTNF